MKKALYTLAICAGAMFAASSCVSLETPPYGSESDATFWTENENAAFATLNSCYTRFYSIGQMLESESGTDNAYGKGVSSQEPVARGSLTTDNSYIKGMWDGFYAGIRTCNELLTNIDRVPESSLSAELRARYIAEARVIRASHYYELASRWGDVPYTEKVLSVNESREIARTPYVEVMHNVTTTLEAVLESNALPASYGAGDRGRITCGAAKALLAKVYLFMGNYEKVRDLTDEIMTSHTYELYPSYEGLFTVDAEYNKEIILDVEYAPVSREWNMRSIGFIPPSMGGYCSFGPTQELVDSYIMLNGKGIKEEGSGFDKNNEFDNRDPRLKMTIIYNGNSYATANGDYVVDTVTPDSRDAYSTTSDVTPTGYYLRKWYDKKSYVSSTTSASINAIIIRYADILLMNAEAHAELGSMNATVWDKTIKPIRQRAGFTEAGALNFPSGNVKEIIRNERRCELAFEGQRQKDIIRWRIAENVLNGYAHGLYTGAAVGTDQGYVKLENRQFDPAKHYLWPIPQKERDLNTNLTQNPNW